MITAKELRKYIVYDPKTGRFSWLRSRGSRAAGDSAGMKTFDGYLHIGFRGKLHQAHRLAWLWMTGKWPKTDIDHKNRDPSDNKWDNLRLASNSQNRANSAKNKNNTSGFKGVSLDSGGKWKAQICVNWKKQHLGLFDTKKEARAAYLAAASTFFGDFANVS